jgi:hypothetical protein
VPSRHASLVSNLVLYKQHLLIRQLDVAAHGGVLKSEYSILYGVVAIIFLISGMQITRDKLVSHLTSWRLHLYVQGISFLLIPGIILGICPLDLPLTKSNKLSPVSNYQDNHRSWRCLKPQHRYQCACWTYRSRLNTYYHLIKRGFNPQLWRR